MEDLTGQTYTLQIGPHLGQKATVIGRDPEVPSNWLVSSHGSTWTVSELALRSVLADEHSRNAALDRLGNAFKHLEELGRH